MQIRSRYGGEEKLIHDGRKTLGKLGGNDGMTPDKLRTTLGWSTGPDAVPVRKRRNSFFGKFTTMLQVVPLFKRVITRSSRGESLDLLALSKQCSPLEYLGVMLCRTEGNKISSHPTLALANE